MSLRISPSLIAWLLVGLAANLPAAFGSASWATQVLVCVVGLAHCVFGFWKDGGKDITAPGIYFFAAGLFVYFPGIFIALNGVSLRHGPMELVATLNYWFLAQLVMYHLVWERRKHPTGRPEPVTSPEVLRWARATGITLTAIGVVLSVGQITDSLIASGFAFTGVVMVACATFLRPAPLSPLSYLLVGGAAIAYMELVFVGFGRLQLGALGLALATALVHRFRGRLVKAGLLLASFPTLTYLGAHRVAFTTDARGASAAAGNTGLESVFSPLVRSAELWHMNATQGLDYSYLRTFFASLVAMVPRELWSGKPVGFGAELASLFRPEYDGLGHSELALLSGEFLFAAGWFGLLVMPFALAAIVLVIDRLLRGRSAVDVSTRARLLRAVGVLILAASIADLVWGGTFAYSSRVGPRLLVLVAVFVLFAWRRRRDTPPTGVPGAQELVRVGSGPGRPR